MSSTVARSRLGAVIFFAGVLPALISLSARLSFGSEIHENGALHESLELAGSSFALVVAMLVWLRGQQDGQTHLLCVSVALAGMGLIDLLHAVAQFGVVWSWLRHGSTLVGGLLFALVWLPLPGYLLRGRQYIILLVVVIVLTGSAVIYQFPDLLPRPWGPEGYSLGTKAANSLGGIGFLAAAIFFSRRYLVRPEPEDLAFAGHTLLFASAAFLFGFSHVWAADWWAWHGFRLLAYGVVLVAAYAGIVALYQRTTSYSAELERRVESRTTELRALAAIVESSDDAIFSKSLEGVIRTWNGGAVELYGYTAAEAIGQPMTLVVPQELHNEVCDFLERIRKGGSVKHHETVRVRKDGRRVDVSVTISAVRDSRGEITGAAAIARDITDRRRAERERQRAEYELEQFFMVSPDMLCIAGFDGNFKRLNPAWTKTLGWSLDQLLAEPWLNFVHPDDRGASLATQREQTDGKSTLMFENRYRVQDGSYRWFRWNSRPDRESRLIFAAARDVTAERIAADELRRSRNELETRVQERTAELELTNRTLHEQEALFRKLFEGSPIGAVLVGLDGKLTHVNSALGDWLGYRPGEMVGLTLEEIAFPEDRITIANLLGQLMDGEVPGLKLVNRYVRKNGGAVWGDLTATTIRDDAGNALAILGMLENITERFQRDQEISRLNRELETHVAELTLINQELESFNYSVSHDLRAPLRHIDGFSKALLEEYAKGRNDDAHGYVERIRNSVRRMGRMVDELLELSRTSRRELSRQLTGLRSVVLEVIEELKAETPNRQIEWRIADLPFVDCDPILTRQVFANLLSNAVKFSRTRASAVIEVGQTLTDGELVLFVQDNGVGFSMKYAHKLFGVFERLHRQEDFEGTGIGLATVQRIIHKHGGRIWSKAELEKGATFYFTLEARGRHAPILPEPQIICRGES